ncbi:NAD-dependent epimerase/dehydratase family protein [Alphaproteobacteria bacterium]|nr:NAD-dependent epimerase/dehydratase family protein [Alphaproteobacteria bacterium]
MILDKKFDVTILLTGSSGFVGAAVAKSIAASSFGLVAPTRTGSGYDNISQIAAPVETIGEINGTTDWGRFLQGVKTIVHCAAVSEVGRNPTEKQLYVLQSVNIDGTLNLARQAALSGVGRFVFLSSIKVNGDSTKEGAPFMCDDSPLPVDAYGRSKLDAERGLQNIAQEAGMEFVIIRPPLVYGPGVIGNFRMLMKLVEYGVPLPLSNIRNKRSFIGIDNLVDLIIACTTHPNAANRTFLASDDDDLSTSELLYGIAQAMGKPSRLFSCPKQVLVAAAKCVGKSNLADKLLGSLQVDISETKNLLSWVPPVSAQDGLYRCFPKP